MSPFVKSIPIHVIPMKAVYRTFLKRSMDISISGLLICFLSPVLLLISGLIVLEGGPIFFGHVRVGRHGTRFACLKFRTMRTDAAAALAALLVRDPAARAEWDATRKLRHDPRVTRVGRLLRATSLDELPQLFNVLRGEMSLVGPRPVTQDELDRYYIPECAQAAYLSVRPGITGVWQVGGRNDLGYTTRVALDCAYAGRPSLRADVMILFRTFNVVVRRKGAY
jgi:exopolysaccharide production protein ExoY